MDMKSEIVSTGLTVEKRKFTWRIENFDMVRKSDEVIDAQKFRFKAGESIDLETEWVVCLDLRDTEEGADERWIGIYLQCAKAPSNVKGVPIICKISIQKSGINAGFYRRGSFERNYFPIGSDWGFHRFLRQAAKMEELPLVDGSLVVEMELHLFAPAKITTNLDGIGFVEAEFERKSVKKLQSDLGKLFDSSDDYSEGKTKIISKDNVEFGVSVGLLSARSPVFKAMLGTDMLEANSGVIRIDELSSKTISVL